MNRRGLLLLLRVGIGVALLVWVLRRVDFSEASRLSLSSLQPGWVLGAVLLSGLSVAGWALRWHLFLRMLGVAPAFRETLRLTLFADFFNLYFLGPLGADGLRMLMLRRQFPGRTVPIAMTILLDHVSGLFGGAILYVLFTRTQTGWLLEEGSAVSPGMLLSADIFLGSLVVVTLMGLVVICQPGLQRFMSTTLRIPWAVKPLLPFSFLRDHKVDTLLAQLVSLFTLTCTYAAYWAAGCAAGYVLSPGKLFAIMPMVDVVTSLPITVSGIGVRENLFVELLGREPSLGPAGAVTFSLLGFAAVGVWGLTGGVWMALHRWRTRQRPVELRGDAEAIRRE